MASQQALVTVVTRNYLHYAAVLAAACRRWQPSADFYTLIADGLPAGVDCPAELANQLQIEDLGIDDWRRFAFQYTPFELSCALKPYVMARLLERGYERVVYLDGDLCLYGPLAALDAALDTGSLALTPHLHRPLPRDGRKPAENNYLNAGTFNGGLLACRNDDTGRNFLQWWQSHLRHDCYVDVANGVFVDQKWLNLVPGLFSQVNIVRHPGCNAGHWTLSQFPLTGSAQAGYRVGEWPLECFHFSNFLPSNPYEFMHSQSRVSFRGLPALEELVHDYHRQLAHYGGQTYAGLGCGFDRLSDGTVIKPEWREAVRRRLLPALAEGSDPFDVQSQPELVATFEKLAERARKWRADWREATPSQQTSKQHRKRWKNYVRHLKSRWFGRKAA